jgi:AcrR family transcriptional regulator
MAFGHAIDHDVETHDRLLNAAARLFAARGFNDVTVREICSAAGANVAAINYHFGDKLGLYHHVLNEAIHTMRATTEAARKAGEGGTPETKLRAYIRVVLQRVAGAGHDSWIHQLMTRELADPTPALDLVTEQVIRPRLAYVGQIIGEMLGRRSDDETVLLCVLSIQSQGHAAMANPIAKRLLPHRSSDTTALNRLADHIVEFSVGGIRAAANRRKVHDP